MLRGQKPGGGGRRMLRGQKPLPGTTPAAKRGGHYAHYPTGRRVPRRTRAHLYARWHGAARHGQSRYATTPGGANLHGDLPSLASRRSPSSPRARLAGPLGAHLFAPSGHLLLFWTRGLFLVT